jgi:CHAT domain-containing protein
VAQSLGGAQTQALAKISKILHDHFFCALARTLAERGITQLILIPDTGTRNLPLHLAYVCGKEFSIPGIDTQDANYLCEVMPVEYSPCLQAVAASQVYVRPKALRLVAGFADPNGDLPGAQVSMQEFAERSGNPTALRLASGAAATKAAVTQALAEADVLLFGTHGSFVPGNSERTHLVLHGEPWTMSDMQSMPELQKRALLVLVACQSGAIDTTPDDRDAWGIPGALVAAGASAVLGNLWPVEDITSGYLLDRFLVHLGHRGYRPAAALFRAVRDLRRMSRDEALEYCRRHLQLMKESNAPARVLLGARTILEFIEDHDDSRPFAHPFFWGATAIFGSGWHLPAGAVVGPPEIATGNLLKQLEADGLIEQGKPLQALAVAKHVAATADGVPRGRAYATMALALLRSADLSTERRVRAQASRLLKMAERIARNEEDEELTRRAQWVQAQMEDNDVVPKNG